MQCTESKFESSLVTPTPLYPNFNLQRSDSWGGGRWKGVRGWNRSTNGVIYTGGILI